MQVLFTTHIIKVYISQETEIARQHTWEFPLFTNKVLLLQRLTQRVVQKAAAGGILIILKKKKEEDVYSAAFLK